MLDSRTMRLEEIPDEYFQRQDETSDFQFYRSPRLVAHIDDAAIEALGSFLRPRVPQNADVLDLMSAYLTHLPPDVRAKCRRVAGLGMNGLEMAANSQLTEYVVHSLNDDPALPYPDLSFDLALCTVSVQYLLHPAEVFAEVCRVLRPGGQFIASFSNRCFPTKATRLWLSTDDAQHLSLVQLFFEESGGWSSAEAFDKSPHPGRSDPLYVVVGTKSTLV
ncbi:MAG: class I SAM-dependent methyltransferase [Janthinobacterium lividum]